MPDTNRLMSSTQKGSNREGKSQQRGIKELTENWNCKEK